VSTVVLIALPWLPGGACREPDVDPEWFFPHGENYDRGREVCRRCPVKVQCGQWAMDTGQEFGLWGALTPEERKRLRRMRAVAS
jgi:WhiB family redox-sensing transcriptional regulator